MKSFAHLVAESWDCHVRCAILDQPENGRAGIAEWWIQNAEEANFVIILCSSEKRSRTPRNIRKLTSNTTAFDTFSLATDAYSNNVLKLKYNNVTEIARKYIVAYFNDLSSENDIPFKMKQGRCYSLMQDIFHLYSHIHQLQFASKENENIARRQFTRSLQQCASARQLVNYIMHAKQHVNNGTSCHNCNGITNPTNKVSIRQSKSDQYDRGSRQRNGHSGKSARSLRRSKTDPGMRTRLVGNNCSKQQERIPTTCSPRNSLHI